MVPRVVQWLQRLGDRQGALPARQQGNPTRLCRGEPRLAWWQEGGNMVWTCLDMFGSTAELFNIQYGGIGIICISFSINVYIYIYSIIYIYYIIYIIYIHIPTAFGSLSFPGDDQLFIDEFLLISIINQSDPLWTTASRITRSTSDFPPVLDSCTENVQLTQCWTLHFDNPETPNCVFQDVTRRMPCQKLPCSWVPCEISD